MKHKYLFIRRYRIANTLGQRLEKLITVSAHTKDIAVMRIIEFMPDCSTADLDFIQEVLPEHFAGIMGVDIPDDELTPMAAAVRRILH